MALVLTPDQGVPLTPQQGVIDLHERVRAVSCTADILAGHGYELEEASQEAQDIAAALATSYAASPETTSKQVTTQRAAALPPASLIETRRILDEFGSAVVRHSIEIRHLVTNKLLLESENPDPRVRIRALELLGKITDVGLFTERSEVTITHQSTEDLRKTLREKFNRILNKDVQDVVVIDDIDVDKELGITRDTPNE
jgi:cobalamin biosynthesis protein CbiD